MFDIYIYTSSNIPIRVCYVSIQLYIVTNTYLMYPYKHIPITFIFTSMLSEKFFKLLSGSILLFTFKYLVQWYLHTYLTYCTKRENPCTNFFWRQKYPEGLGFNLPSGIYSYLVRKIYLQGYSALCRGVVACSVPIFKIFNNYNYCLKISMYGLNYSSPFQQHL